MTPNKILLIGPMGAGKSTIGKLLAQDFEWDYFDNDSQMESLFGFSLQALSVMPVDELHQLERQYVKEIMQKPAPFISGAAGSVVDTPEIRELIKKSFAIYLRIPLEKVIKRAGGSGVGRQVVSEKNSEILKERFLFRDPLYRECARFTIDLGKSPEDDVRKIIKSIRN